MLKGNIMNIKEIQTKLKNLEVKSFNIYTNYVIKFKNGSSVTIYYINDNQKKIICDGKKEFVNEIKKLLKID
jgi:hypothetical protein